MAVRHLNHLFKLRTLFHRLHGKRVPVTVQWHKSAVEISLDLGNDQVARGVAAMVVETEIELIEALYEALSMAIESADKEVWHDR